MNHLTILDPQIYEKTCKRSKFISYSFPVNSENDVRLHLKNVKNEHHSAKHHVYAYILEENGLEKYSDDGEPCGTAGLPILNAIKSTNLTNVLVIIVRYFGGVLLGPNGLRTMYHSGATEVLKKSELIEVIPYENIKIATTYKKLSKVLYVIKQYNGKILENKFENEIYIEAAIPKERLLDLKNTMVHILEGSGSIEII